MNRFSKLQLASVCALVLSSCAPTPGPDKVIAGTILGAGWGAGSGAIIGNQINNTGAGVAVGAGLGAAAGMLVGAGLDVEEGSQLKTRRQIYALRAHVAQSEENLLAIRESLLGGGRLLAHLPSSITIYFDPRLAALRTGSAKELERLAESIKRDPLVRRIEIFGHSDDTGTKEDNEKLSLARARTVESFLAEHGISLDQMKSSGLAAAEPKTTNRTDAGRQLNRRVEIVLLR